MSQTAEELTLGIVPLFILIFLEGFVSISLEVLTIRQLIPVVGNSVIVTSLIIGIFLLFLALGYYRGGFYRKNYLAILQKNFSIAAVIFGIGLSYLFIQYTFMSINTYVTTSAFAALFIYLLLITAPMIFILGQTVPITTNLFRHKKHVGSISGTVLYVSTLGSFLGAVLTAAVLMNFFGVAWTIIINFLSIFALILLLQAVTKKKWHITLGVIFAGAFIFVLNVQYASNFFLNTTAYNNYLLIKRFKDPDLGEGRLLSVNNSASSFLNDQLQGFEYIELIKRILFKELGLTNKEILVIGAGGFSLSAEGDFGNHFEYIDIDKAIKPVALNGFIKKINGTFIAEDARKFLLDKSKLYDVIISDAYSNLHAIPFYLLTREHMQNIRRALKDQGYAVFNIIASPTLESKYAKRIDNTIHSVFPSCSGMPSSFKGKVASMIYICKKTAYDQEKGIYTDNLNTITLDYYNR